ncbi:hypothetical protein H0H87_007843 [Tephrocybe sp. NHM501043]|nr:hypothetical protein H0H87_007843 [Tephrocybe sp. NHM501043]
MSAPTFETTVAPRGPTPTPVRAVVPTANFMKGACGIAPETREPDPTDKPVVELSSASHAVFAQVKLLWNSGSTISYSYFGRTNNQQAAVDLVAQEWTYYANLSLQRQADSDKTAMVRIAFAANAGSWSSIGKGALDIKDGGITMNLGWIEDSPTISDNDRGTILHEWGHALGLMHEHQSPARGGKITLNPTEVYSYYRATQGWSDALIKSQILDVFNTENVSNYSQLDITSIMMYFMPARINYEHINVNVNNKLSEMDKAYMVINYTRNVPHPKAKEWTLKKALDVAGVPPSEQEDILLNSDSGTIRAYFASWNKEVRSAELAITGVIDVALAPRGLNSQTAATLYPEVQQNIWSGITDVLKNPAFQQVAGTVVNSVLTQRGLNPQTTSAETASSSPTIQQGILSGLVSVFQNPVFQQVVGTVVNAAFGPRPTELPVASDIQQPPSVASGLDPQQGLFSLLTNVVGAVITSRGLNPQATLAQADIQQGIFSGLTLTDIVENALTQRGLSTQGISTQYPDVQRGIWSGIVDVLKNPAFQQIVGTVIDATLSQHGISAGIVAPISGIQNGIQNGLQNGLQNSLQNGIQNGLLSDVGSFLSHPLVRQTLSGIVDATLSQRGLSPQAISTQNPQVQRGIWSGIILTNTFDTVLTGRGVNAQTLANQYPDVQKSIWSGLVGVLDTPAFQKLAGSVVDAALAQHGLSSTQVPTKSVPSDISSQYTVQQALRDLASGVRVKVSPPTPIYNPSSTASDVYADGLGSNGLFFNGLGLSTYNPTNLKTASNRLLGYEPVSSTSSSSLTYDPSDSYAAPHPDLICIFPQRPEQPEQFKTPDGRDG